MYRLPTKVQYNNPVLNNTSFKKHSYLKHHNQTLKINQYTQVQYPSVAYTYVYINDVKRSITNITHIYIHVHVCVFLACYGLHILCCLEDKGILLQNSITVSQ